MSESGGRPVRVVPNRCPYCGGGHKPEMCPRLSGISCEGRSLRFVLAVRVCS